MGRRMALAAALAGIALGPSSCGRQETGGGGKRGAEMGIEKRPFGTAPDGRAVDLYALTNSNGLRMRVTNYGGIIVSLEVPDRTGKLDDIVLGYDTLEAYIRANPYFGCIVGRYANRIAKGTFTLDGVPYTLARNDGENHLHGGTKGFDKVVWKAEEVREPDAVGLRLAYSSKDMEEGYPGNLKVEVVYRLTDRDELEVDYTATTDKPTVVNLTQHTYFNLAGAGMRDILDHAVMIDADRFTPVDAGLIPTGELRPVDGTPFDFRAPTPIGARIGAQDAQLALGKGYDHNFVLNGKPGELRLAARVEEPTTGRILEVRTTEPGVQFYVGNFLDGTNIGKGGRPYRHRYGFCLETQHFPDSPNRPEFPSVVLRPGETYRHRTVFAFSTKRESR